MKKTKRVLWLSGIIIAISVSLFTVLASGQDRGRLPNLDEDAEKKQEDASHPLSRSERSKVSVFVMSNQGPMGELYYPTGIDDKLSESNFKLAETEHNFRYPSIYFDISATPLFGEGEDPEGRDFDLRWLDVEIRLDPVCRKPEEGKPKQCTLWLVDMYPNVSSSGKKDNPFVTGVSIAEQFAKLAEPFFLSASGKALNAKIGAGTNGLGVLFRNLLPPTIRTYFHPRITSGRAFGWTLRQDRTADQPSLLGIHRGLVFLQAGKNVTGIKVTSVVKSLWNKDVSSEGKAANFSRIFTLMLPDEPANEQPVPAKIKSLANYPALIPMSEVCKIFSVNDSDCHKLETLSGLKTTIKNGQNTAEVCFPSVVNDDEATKKVVFSRSAIQVFLGIDQPLSDK